MLKELEKKLGVDWTNTRSPGLTANGDDMNAYFIDTGLLYSLVL